MEPNLSKREPFQIHAKFCMSNEKSVRNSLKTLSKGEFLIKSSYGAKIAEKGAIPDSSEILHV